ncbi:MAG: hypothetical protein GX346_07490 [Clostridiales bacterium]|nr:hypothetical protein [Clostridiales bacterium]
MKKVIIITALVLAIAIFSGIAVFTFNKHEIIFTSNVISSNDDYSYTVTQAYVSDKDEVANVRTILDKINSETPPPDAADIAMEIAQRGNIIFAPVFSLDISTVEGAESVFRLNGSVKNGIDSQGNEVIGNYKLDGLNLAVSSDDITIIAASDGYYPSELVEITSTPFVISEAKNSALIPFSVTNGFEIFFTVKDLNDFSGISFDYSFDVKGSSSFNFSKLEEQKLNIRLDFENKDNKVTPVFSANAVELSDESSNGED